MLEFHDYARQLEALALQDSPRVTDVAVELALNGQAARELRQRVPLAKRRASGAFFSPPKIVESVRSRLAGELDSTSIVLDPACGAGDLLLGVARELGAIPTDPAKTLVDWSRQLLGLDLYREFIRAARARLTLLARALAYGREVDGNRRRSALESIRVGSGLGMDAPFSLASHVVMNPPYASVPTPRWIDWTSGIVNQAALFCWVAATRMSAGGHLVAVVPDVLRSGSRYTRFRSRLEELGDLSFPEKHSRFDPYTDVHTTLLELKVGNSPQSTFAWPAESSHPRISDHFQVHVGSVVPHRLNNKGKWWPYLFAGTCPRWGTVSQKQRSIRFAGTLFAPPFVVVRRTSRPEDRFRAVPTLVLLEEDVAVENHLLVLVPRDGSAATCRRLLAVLRKPATSNWLNNRIRCRHLTVGAVENVPWAT